MRGEKMGIADLVRLVCCFGRGGNLLGNGYFGHSVSLVGTFICNGQWLLEGRGMVIRATLKLDFLPIYGGSWRLGVYESEGLEWFAGGVATISIPMVLWLSSSGSLIRRRAVWLKPTRKYELTDHLGNVRVVIADQRIAVPDSSGQVVAYYKPKVVGVYDYYPYGWVKIRTGGYWFGANGGSLMESWDSTGGTYYTLFRMLDSRVGRWWGVEPRWEEYVEVSGYGVNANAPTIVAGWFGSDTLKLNQANGKVEAYIRSEGDDVFIIVDSTGREIKRLVLPENTLQRVKIEEYGDRYIVDERVREGRVVYRDSSNFVLKMWIRGDEHAERLFKFLADNIAVEWSWWQAGAKKIGELNVITTTGLRAKEIGGPSVFAGQLVYGYTLRMFVHSHPKIQGFSWYKPSAADIRFKQDVIRAMKELDEYYRSVGYYKHRRKIPVFKIYIPGGDEVIY